jgi:integrase
MELYKQFLAHPEATPGSTARATGDHRKSLRHLCNEFLNYKRKKIGKKIGQRMFDEYEGTVQRLVKVIDRRSVAQDLTPADFVRLRDSLEALYGPVRLGNEVGKVKTIFKWGVKHGVIKHEPAYGDFDKPSRDELRKHRAKKGKRLFTAEQLLTLIDAASPQIKAMLLLGINAGFGNHDSATVPFETTDGAMVLDLDNAVIEYPRPKNGTPRRCPLWPETIAAIKAAIFERPKPADKEAARHVFLMQGGKPWLCRGIANPISVAVRDLMQRTKVHREGLGLYALRHTFRTIADAAKDIPAIRLIMGHSDGSIDAVYREHIDDWRLQAVTDYVRKWLFPDAEKPATVAEPQGTTAKPTRAVKRAKRPA